jgi:hypothetical protein
MADWVLVENNEIVEYHSLLPKNWKNVSGLNLLVSDLPALKSHGWYPVSKETIDEPAETEHYTIREEFEYTIRENDVLEKRIIVKTGFVPDTVIDPYAEFLTSLRTERDKRLQASDFTQLSDIQNRLSDQEKILINTYRQQLRDLPTLCMEQGIFDLTQVNWPENVSISIN